MTERSLVSRARVLRRSVLTILTLLVCVSCAAAAGRSEGSDGLTGMILVGVASVDITPEEPIRLTGYPDRREPTDSIRQRLRAKALAFGSDADGPALLLTADLIGIPRHISDELARRLEGSGVERARFVATATHTHNGPALSGVLPHIFEEPVTPDQQAAIERYTQQLVSRLEQAAIQALADRRPARLRWGQGTADIAANRRIMRDGKWTGFGVNPDGPVDHDLPVLTIAEPDGALRAILLSYATHGTTLVGTDNFVHGDWPGTAQQLLEERHPGALALVMIGAGADTDPSPRAQGIPDVDRNAAEIAAQVDRVLNGPMSPLTMPLSARFRAIELPFERIPTRAELERQAGNDDARSRYARAVLARLDRGETLDRTAPYSIQTWTFGDQLAMVFLAGEVVLDYGKRLKAELDASRLWVTAYANDVAFYVASDRLMAEGGYEVDGSMVYYGQPSRLARSTEDLIVRTIHELLPPVFGAGTE